MKSYSSFQITREKRLPTVHMLFIKVVLCNSSPDKKWQASSKKAMAFFNFWAWWSIRKSKTFCLLLFHGIGAGNFPHLRLKITTINNFSIILELYRSLITYINKFTLHFPLLLLLKYSPLFTIIFFILQYIFPFLDLITYGLIPHRYGLCSA